MIPYFIQRAEGLVAVGLPLKAHTPRRVFTDSFSVTRTEPTCPALPQPTEGPCWALSNSVMLRPSWFWIHRMQRGKNYFGKIRWLILKSERKEINSVIFTRVRRQVLIMTKHISRLVSVSCSLNCCRSRMEKPKARLWTNEQTSVWHQIHRMKHPVNVAQWRDCICNQNLIVLSGREVTSDISPFFHLIYKVEWQPLLLVWMSSFGS